MDTSAFISWKERGEGDIKNSAPLLRSLRRRSPCYYHSENSTQGLACCEPNPLSSAMLLCLLALPSHTADAPPSAYGEPASSAPPTTSFLSRTLGSGMVLQRAPQRAVVWGHVAAGTTVSTTMTGGGAHQLLTTVAGGDGIWRQALPAVPASPTPHKLAFKASTGETAAIENVLFGDVYLCGGQSNMQFSMPVIENSTQEIARADG